jgi:polyhydroxybutyrate depolymerase
VFHVAGTADPQVTFADQKVAMVTAVQVNGVRERTAKCGDGCTLYGPDTPAPVMTWIHPGGHVYPRDTSERIVAFFRQHPRSH